VKRPTFSVGWTRCFVFLVGLLASLAAGTASAIELLVPETYATIQAALDVALSGDVVSVAPGVYPENVRTTSNGVTLRSRIRHEATIQGDGTEHVVVFNTYSGIVEGFIITGAETTRRGVFTSQAQSVIRDNLIIGNARGGIAISANSVATIEANLIIDNGLNHPGSGIHIAGGTSGTIVNNYIAGSRRGIYVFHAGGLDIVNNTLVDNSFIGLYLTDDPVIIRNNIIIGSDYGIYMGGEYAFDITSYVAQFLTIDHNVLWGIGEWVYFASLGGVPIGNLGPFIPFPGTGEIYANPLLNPVSGYELLADSPAIDAGDNEICPETDLDSHLRPYDGNDPPDGFADCDIGAVEFVPESHGSVMMIAGMALLGALYRRR
jgi:parallel beta-helix repeat protein